MRVQLHQVVDGDPSELIDQRDIAIDQLAALAEIRTVRQPDGTIDVNLASGTPEMREYSVRLFERLIEPGGRQ